jgi:hypothetical protein
MQLTIFRWGFLPHMLRGLGIACPDRIQNKEIMFRKNFGWYKNLAV